MEQEPAASNASKAERENIEPSLPAPVLPAGHKYSSTSVGGNAHAHFGDVNHLHYHLAPSQEDKYATLHDSLTFERMDARHRNVDKAMPDTCQWLFSHKQFEVWRDRSKTTDHHDLLWIKGKPGSGKSTIMKEALEWAEEKWSTETEIVLSYFFNARATGELEKSSLGMYRSLLHQLLSIVPDIHPLFLSTFWLKEKGGRTEDWSEIELQNFFFKIFALPPAILRPVNILIDALDEGQNDDVRRMLDFLDGLRQRATLSAVQLRICLSSRYYPNITFESALFIYIDKESEQNRDIERYVAKKLGGNHGPKADELRKEVVGKAAGVFLWVVLVVQKLKEMYDHGKPPSVMLKKLSSIPQDLHNLFATLLNPNDEDFEERITLLQCVMFSLRPLTPIELHLAIQQAHAQSEMDETQDVNQVQAANYILNHSRGLVEFSTRKGYHQNRYEVQFIHETVRDYLKASDVLSRKTLNAQDSLSLSLTETGDMVIAEACLQYILHFSESSSPSGNRNDDGKVEYDHGSWPWLKYARDYWWQHLQRSPRACTERISQLSVSLITLEDVRSYKLLLWCITHEAFETSMTPLYIASFISVPKLVLAVLPRTADVNARGGKYGNALQAASVMGHLEVVRILLEHGADINA